MKSAPAQAALIFNWDYGVRFILPGFILLSFLAHVGAFFMFRVVYPPQESLPMPPPPVTVLDPSRPDHQSLLRWAEAEDSSPAAAQTSVTDRLLEVSYRPSFSTVRTAPLTLSPSTGQIQYPPPRDPLTLIRSVEAKPSPPTPPAPTAATRISFTGSLADRAAAVNPVQISNRSTVPLETTEFMVGATDRGELRFVVLQHSSGNEALDSEVAEQISRMRLAKSDEPITWGKATVQWGADAYASSGK